MSRTKLEFCILASLIVITRIGDITTTYLITPGLESELNPIVSIFGQGWIAVIIIQIILVSVAIILNYYSLFILKPSYPSQAGYSFIEFLTDYYFGKKQKLIKLLYKFPKNKSTLIISSGYILPRALIVVSILISLSSTFVIISSSYRNFYSAVRVYYYIVLVAISLVFYFMFFKREYAVYQKNISFTSVN